MNGDTRDIIRLILRADGMSAKFIDTRNVRHLLGRDDYRTLENIYWFVKKNTRYQTDPRGEQNVRLPGYLFDTGAGDCKSYSIAIGALCRALGIPYKYRFVRQRGAGNYHHVYIVAAVRDGSGRGPVALDAVHRNFDHELAYEQKLDLMPGQSVPGNISGMATGGIAWIVPIIIIGLLAATD